MRDDPIRTRRDRLTMPMPCAGCAHALSASCRTRATHRAA